MMTHRAFCYVLALVGVSAAMGLRLALESRFGPGLPAYITFYPIVMLVAVLAGFWPGVFATAMSSLIVDYWILPPIGHLSVDSTIDKVGMAFFIAMGLFMSGIAELYRRNRIKAAAYDREVDSRLTQEALRESEARFHVMVNAMPQLGWIAQPDGYINWYNERWYKYTGTTPEQMEGWGWQIVHDPVELPKVLDRWKTSIATGKPFEMTFPLRGVDGNFRQFLTRVFPLKNADGGVVQWFGTNTDVEEQIHAEKLLREHEAQRAAELAQAAENMRLFVKQAPLIIAMFDCSMNYLAASDLWINAYGRGYTDLVGRNHYEFHPDIPDEWKKIHQQCMAGATLKNDDDYWEQSDGKKLWLKWAVVPWHNQDGKIGGIIITSEDITERKLNEEALRESKQRLQAHIENSPMAVVSWDKDFFVTQWAGEAERIFGWKSAETIGKPIMDMNMIYEEDLALVQETMAKIMAAQRYVVSHNRNVTKDGRVIYCVWFNSILSNKDGAMDSVMSLVLDVTEQKQLEQEMATLNIQLTHNVAKRTAEISALTAHVQKVAETERAR